MIFFERITRFARSRLVKASFACALSFSLAFAPFTEISFAPSVPLAEASTVTTTNLNQPDLTTGVLGFALENVADILNGTIPLYINRDPLTGTFYISEQVSGPTAFQRNPATGKHNIVAAGIPTPYLQSLSTSLIGMGQLVSKTISSLPISLMDALRLLPKLGAMMDFAKNNPDIVKALTSGNIAGLNADQISRAATFLGQNPVLAQVGIKQFFGINLSQGDICTACNFMAANPNLTAAVRDYALIHPELFGTTGGSLTGGASSAGGISGLIDAVRPGGALSQIAPSLNGLDKTTLFNVFDYGIANKATLTQIAAGNYAGVTPDFIQKSAQLVTANPSLATSIANQNLIPGIPVDAKGICTMCNIASNNPYLAKAVFDYGVSAGGLKGLPLGAAGADAATKLTAAQVDTYLSTLDTKGVYAPYVTALNTVAKDPTGAAQIGDLLNFGATHPSFFNGTPTAADVGAAATTMLRDNVAGQGIVDVALKNYGLTMTPAQYCSTCNGVKDIATQYPNFTQATLAGLMAANPGTGGSVGTGGTTAISQASFDSALKAIAPGGAFFSYAPTLEKMAQADSSTFTTATTFLANHASGVAEIANSGGLVSNISEKTLGDFFTFAGANPKVGDMIFSQAPTPIQDFLNQTENFSTKMCAACQAVGQSPAAFREFVSSLQTIADENGGIQKVDPASLTQFAANFETADPTTYKAVVAALPFLAKEDIGLKLSSLGMLMDNYTSASVPAPLSTNGLGTLTVGNTLIWEASTPGATPTISSGGPATINLGDAGYTYTVAQTPDGETMGVTVSKAGAESVFVPVNDPTSAEFLKKAYGNGSTPYPVSAAFFKTVTNAEPGVTYVPLGSGTPSVTPGGGVSPTISTFYTIAPNGTLILQDASAASLSSPTADIANPIAFTETSVGGTGLSITVNGSYLAYEKTSGISGTTVTDAFNSKTFPLQPGDRIFDSCNNSTSGICGVNYAIVHSNGTVDAYVNGVKTNSYTYNPGTGGQTVYSIKDIGTLPAGPAELSSIPVTGISGTGASDVKLASFDPSVPGDMKNLKAALTGDAAYQPVVGPDGKVYVTVTQDGQRFAVYSNCSTINCETNVFAVNPTTGQVLNYTSSFDAHTSGTIGEFGVSGGSYSPGTYVIDPSTKQITQVMDTHVVLNQYDKVNDTTAVASYVQDGENNVSVISSSDLTPYSNASYNPVTQVIFDKGNNTFYDSGNQPLTGTVDFTNSKLGISGTFDTAANVTKFSNGTSVNGIGEVRTPEDTLLPIGTTYNPVQNTATIGSLGTVDLGTGSLGSDGAAHFTSSKGFDISVQNDNGGGSVAYFQGKDGTQYRLEGGQYVVDSTDQPVDPSVFADTGNLGAVGITNPSASGGAGGGGCSTCGGSGSAGGGSGSTGLSLGDAAFNGLVGGLVGGVIGGIGALIGGAKLKDVLKGLAIGVAQGVLGAVLQNVLGGAGGGAGLGAIGGMIGQAAGNIPGIGPLASAIPGMGGGQEVPVADKEVRKTTNSIFGNTQKLQDKQYILDPMAKSIAKLMIQKVAASMISWINHGFNGAPSFVTDPTQFFSNIMNTTAQQFVQAPGGLSGTCGVFQGTVSQLVLAPFASQFGSNPLSNTSGGGANCGLNNNLSNSQGYNAFLTGQQFQWSDWNSYFLDSEANPVTAYLTQQNLLDKKIASNVNTAAQDLNWGRGYQSAKVCAVPDPNVKGACLQWTIQTPGSTIGDLTVQALARTQFDSLIDANEINSIVSALSNQLMSKLFSFGDGTPTGGGLLGLGSTSQPGSYAAQLAADRNAQGNTTVRRQIVAAINAAIRTFKNGKYMQDEKRATSILDAGEKMINEVATCYQDAEAGKHGITLTPDEKAIADNRIKEAQASIIGLIQPARAQWASQDAQNSSIVQSLLKIRSQIASATSAKDAAGIQNGIDQYQALSDQLGLSANGADSSVIDNLYTEVANLSTVIKEALKECKAFPPRTTIDPATGLPVPAVGAMSER